MVFNLNGKWTQYGITSWGQGCAEPGYAGVYGSVAGKTFLLFVLNCTQTIRYFSSARLYRLNHQSKQQANLKWKTVLHSSFYVEMAIVSLNKFLQMTRLLPAKI